MVLNEKVINAFSNVLLAVRKLRYSTLVLIFLGFLVYLFQTELKHLFKVKIARNDRVLTELGSHKNVEDNLQTLMKDSGADRAYVFRFHNGDEYYNGTHKNKLSCDYEVVRNGVSREAVNLQNMPTSLFSEWIASVVNLDMFYEDISHMEDTISKTELERQGIKSIAAVPYYRDGKLLAIIGLDFTRSNTNFWDRGIDATREWIIGRAVRVGDLLL
jgi:hypothetical protein